MLELYQAYADYRDLMEMIETLFQGLADTLLGIARARISGRASTTCRGRFARMTIEEIILANNPGARSRRRCATPPYLRRACDRLEIPYKRAGRRRASCRSRSSRGPASTR